MDRPPPRPKTIEDLGFTCRKPVRWFNPSVLARTGAKVVLSAALGDYLDKRELQESFPGLICDGHRHDPDVWVDFVADTADGFAATYSVAWCASQRELRPAGVDGALPRAQYLVLGGDQVYPYATVREYEERFIGPWRAALPWTDGDHPCLLAIPGNHDWYDGLTGFMRVFAQGNWVGGRQTAQRRSYFAVDLPGPYWLWGIDVGEGANLDAAQIDYFRMVGDHMATGDRLILCTAKPAWAAVKEDRQAYRNLEFVERRLVPRHATTILMISGDKHHYARYRTAAPRADGSRPLKITAGGGGAFLSATHEMDEDVELPWPPTDEPQQLIEQLTDEEAWELVARYPDEERSKRMTWRALALGVRNPLFATVPAILHLLLFIGALGRGRADERSLSETAESWTPVDLAIGVVERPVSLVVALVMVGLLSAFFDLPTSMRGPIGLGTRLVVGTLHTGVHVVAYGLGAWVAIQVAASLTVDGAWFAVVASVLVALFGAVLGPVVFGAYLVASLNRFGRHDTEAFSAFRNEDVKNFLRLHVTADGVTVYPIGIEEVVPVEDLVADPGPADATPTDPRNDASHLMPPGGTIATHLIEDPLTLR